MYTNNTIYMGLSDEGRVCLELSMANRHGLITGASGTGKTITMKVMAESFSDAGVPVFLCDMKGDVSGLCVPGVSNEGTEKRIDKFGIRDIFKYCSYPVCFWDVYGEKGHPVRITVSDLGPELLSRILGLTPAQEGVLNIAFRIADDSGLLLIDLKDLRLLLDHVREHKDEYAATYGHVAPQSLSAILRALLPLENQGGNQFFGEPDLELRDWLRTDSQGRGYINMLDCVRLGQNPLLYATFLLWMLSELYESLPEAGDGAKPKLVFFFDEAHMLFTDAPKALVQKIEQVVRLVRSKGVGVYFVTQSPGDIPDTVLAQLSNRVQHALRAYTPSEQKVIKSAAAAFRPNPAFKTEDIISNLGTGHALVSFLDSAGVPGIVQNTAIICPQSLMAEAPAAERAAAFAADGMSRYDQAFDSVSAFEQIEKIREEEDKQKQLEEERLAFEKEKAEFAAKKEKEEAAKKKREEKEAAKKEKAADRRRQKMETQLFSVGSTVVKRGILGALKKMF